MTATSSSILINELTVETLRTEPIKAKRTEGANNGSAVDHLKYNKC